ncbi:hypothetical protein D3C75_700510 [compost metagenome]
MAAEGFEFLLQDDQILASSSQNHIHFGSGFLPLAELRVQRGRTYAAADADDPLLAGMDVCRAPQRSGEIGNAFAYGFLRQPAGGIADYLINNGYRLLLPVIIGNGQRNALSAFLHPDHNKLSGFAFARHIGRMHDQKLHSVVKPALFENRVHVGSPSLSNAYSIIAPSIRNVCWRLCIFHEKT